jgi:hypothetical protein
VKGVIIHEFLKSGKETIVHNSSSGIVEFMLYNICP